MSSSNSDYRIEEKLYEVEEIVDKKMKKGRFHYCVKWLGFDSSQNTWEPREHLPEEMIDHFEVNLKKKKFCKSLLIISI